MNRLRWSWRLTLERLVAIRPVLVARREARAGRWTRVADPNLAIGMRAAAARGGHRAGTCAMKQPCVGHAAIGMDAAVARDDLVPRRLALLVGCGIQQRGAVELVRIEVGHDLVTLFDQGDRTAKRRFRA